MEGFYPTGDLDPEVCFLGSSSQVEDDPSDDDKSNPLFNLVRLCFYHEMTLRSVDQATEEDLELHDLSDLENESRMNQHRLLSSSKPSKAAHLQHRTHIASSSARSRVSRTTNYNANANLKHYKIAPPQESIPVARPVPTARSSSHRHSDETGETLHRPRRQGGAQQQHQRQHSHNEEEEDVDVVIEDEEGQHDGGAAELVIADEDLEAEVQAVLAKAGEIEDRTRLGSERARSSLESAAASAVSDVQPVAADEAVELSAPFHHHHISDVSGILTAADAASAPSAYGAASSSNSSESSSLGGGFEIVPEQMP